jgi:hypothetical protein
VVEKYVENGIQGIYPFSLACQFIQINGPKHAFIIEFVKGGTYFHGYHKI